jgi:hypothetical protein
VSKQFPPITARLSKTFILFPFSASILAAVNPDGPAPITAMFLVWGSIFF